MERKPTFFRPGGTMEPDAPSYIEREADRKLLESLVASEYVFLLDSRQKGKSSLVARTILKLRELSIGAVKLDLQRIGANVTPEQWYAGLLSGIGQELGLGDELFAYWESRLALGPLARWIGAIAEVVLAKTTGPLVVFIDEVDFVRALPFKTDEFFAGIRDCFNRRSEMHGFERLTFCLVGVATPGQLIRNPEITPFNVGTRIDLADFSRSDTKGYAKELSESGRNGDALLGRVHHWVNGHPYLTQLLCSRIALDSKLTTTHDVDRLIKELFLTPEARQREPNLADVERRILDPDVPGLSPDERRTQVLELYGRLLQGKGVDASEENPVVASLRLAGVGNEDRGALRVRNRIYAHVFDERWRRQSLPQAEMRRMRGAAQMAMLRTASVAGLLIIGVTTGAVGVYRISKDREAALKTLAQKTNDLSKVSNDRQKALTDLEIRNQELKRVSGERKTALVTLETANQSLALTSKERQEALSNLEERNKRISYFSNAQESVIRLLNTRTEELARKQYSNDFQIFYDGLVRGNGRRSAAYFDALKTSKYRNWEYGFASLLASPVEFEAKFTSRSNLEIGPNGKLRVITPDALFEITNDSIRRLISIKNPVSTDERQRIKAMDTAPPYHFSAGVKSNIRFWYYDQRKAIGLHDATTNEVLLPAKKNDTIWDIDPESEIYFYTSMRRQSESSNDLVTDKIEIRSIAGDRLLASISGPEWVNAGQFLPNGTILARFTFPDNKGELRIFDRNGKTIRSLEFPDYDLANIGPISSNGLFAHYSYTMCEVRRVSDFSILCTLPKFERNITDLRFSPDGSMIVTASADGMVRIFDTNTGSLIRTFFGYPRFAMKAAFTSDGTRIAALDSIGNLKIWQVEPPLAIDQIKGANALEVTYSKSQNELVWYSTGGKLFSKNVTTGKTTHKDLGRSNINPSRFAKYIFVGMPDGTIQSLDPTTLNVHRKAKLFRDGDVVWPFYVLPDGKRVVVTYLSKEQAAAAPEVKVDALKHFFILDTESLKIVGRFDTENWPSPPVIKASLLVRYLASIGWRQKDCLIVDAVSGREVRRVRTERTIFDISQTPDGKCLVTSVAENFGDQDGELQLYSLDSGKKIGKFEYSGDVIFDIKFSSDGKRFVGSTRGGEAFLWNFETKRLVAKLTNGGDVRWMSFSPDGERIVSSGNEGEYLIWDSRTGSELLRIRPDVGPDAGGRDRPIFSRDGRKLISNCRDGVIRIWNSIPWKDQPKAARK